jgi:hypothetical protein
VDAGGSGGGSSCQKADGPPRLTGRRYDFGVQTPRLPANEDRRLEALQELEVLDTPTERAFDQLTRLAASILGVPIALVSLVDDSRQ